MLRFAIATGLILLAGALTDRPAAAQDGFPIDPNASCTSASCHNDLGTQKFVHTAAADGTLCITCHEMPQEGRHAFKLAAEGGELCELCHRDMAAKEFSHVPVAEGLCTFCHDPHQSENPNQLLMPATAELCFSCHDDEPFRGDTVHGPVAEGACLKCHDPHTSEHYSQLRTEAPDLCFGCHNRALKDAAGKVLPSPKTTFEDQALKRHVPFEAGECLGCHRPHAGANYRLLVSPYPADFYTSFAPEKYICFDCHDEAAFTNPRTLTDTGFRNGNLNLHYRHVNQKKGRTCRACHHHHAAPNEKLIRHEIPFGTRTINIRKFERTETGGSCAPACHKVVSYDRLEPVDNAFKVTPREGEDATPEELKRAVEEQRVE